MNFDIEKRTILKVRHGSHAYGTNVATSDLDVKGVCIPPIQYHLGFLHKFEQHERMASKGNEHDCVIYSLKKFAQLAVDCNPNIIEVLFVDEDDLLSEDEYGYELRKNRNLFLSRKARWTFSGYAISQLKRIKSHRKWLLDPPKKEPVRSDYNLPETMKISAGELGAFEALSASQDVELPKDVVTLFVREKAYQAAKTHWLQYQNWLTNRNPARAKLEAKFGYDTKHSNHLIRLMRMCKEILTTGEVKVKRPDREELLAIRSGAYSYDQILEMAEKLEQECAALYETSSLPKEPNRVAVDELVIDLTKRYLAAND